MSCAEAGDAFAASQRIPSNNRGFTFWLLEQRDEKRWATAIYREQVEQAEWLFVFAAQLQRRPRIALASLNGARSTAPTR
jgi:hypothetical protein